MTAFYVLDQLLLNSRTYTTTYLSDLKFQDSEAQ